MKAINIRWDISGEFDDEAEKIELFNSLPTELSIPEAYKENLEDISDWLSDEFGFCHYGFQIVFNICEAIKEYCIRKPCQYYNYIPIDDLGYWNVNIQFVHDNREDQTQFDLSPSELNYNTGESPALVQLWQDFCKENKLIEESITSISIVGAW